MITLLNCSLDNLINLITLFVIKYQFNCIKNQHLINYIKFHRFLSLICNFKFLFDLEILSIVIFTLQFNTKQKN
jgi:hypothetical protein